VGIVAHSTPLCATNIVKRPTPNSEPPLGACDAERFVLKVDRLWKGNLPPLAALINLNKRLSPGDPSIGGCDYQIGTKAPSVIFARRVANGDLATGPCTRNGPASDRTLIDSLNKLANPYPPKAGK